MGIFQRLVVLLGAALLGCSSAYGGSYPDHSVKLIVPYSAGGQFDIIARLFSKFASEKLGQPIIVENVPGGNGNIGAGKVARSPNDGYTLLTMSGAHATAHALYNNPGYTLAQLAPIALFGATPQAIVSSKNLPFTTIQALIDYAKKNPGKLSYGTPGVGSTMHLAFERIKAHYNIDIVHVPYGAQASPLNDVVGGQLDIGVVGANSAVKDFLDSGRIHALAITSKNRSIILPNTPTLDEAGYANFNTSSWIGLGAPAKTPPDVIETWNRLTLEFLKDKEMIEPLKRSGFQISENVSPKEFTEFLTEESKIYEKVIQQAKIPKN